MNKALAVWVLACSGILVGVAGARERSAGAPGPYIGFNLGQFQYKEEGLHAITPAGAFFRIGARFSPNLSIEGRVGGYGEGSTRGYSVQPDYLYAGYLKGTLPLTPGFSVYGLAGLGGVHLRRNFGDGDVTASGLSIGLGGEFALGRGTTLSVEWVRLPSGTNWDYDYDMSMASVGLGFRF
jgi:opacity protein-like surface antigen